MQIDKLKLTNFRKFKELEITFENNMTVLVGLNSSGKTSVLDALKIGLWSYVSGYNLGSFSNISTGIQISDVRLQRDSTENMEYMLNSSVELFGDAFGVEHWSRYRESIRKATKTKDDKYAKRLKEEAKKQEKIIFSDSIENKTLPIVCYYGTGRLWSQKNLTNLSKKLDSEKYSKTFAYRDCLEPSSSFKHFIEWYTHIFKRYREAQIKNLEKNSFVNDIDKRLIDPIKVIQTTVNSMIEKHTGWKNLAYSEEMEQEIILENDQKGKLKVNMLSDGIRNIVSLAADIAYRCYKLNPHLGEDAARKTDGIVLIDEIDMHLHPQWQQNIIGDLQEAFPSIQFVITTHSPQVLSTVPSKSIRILEDDRVYEAPKGTQGAESSRILKRVLGVDPRPLNHKVTQKLNRYLELVYSDDYASDDAKVLRDELNEIFADEEPALLEADLYIENKEWERELEKDK
ncbi:AAA family ATPase [Malaciobacter marinus]|jgi:predicted ATP-binding protein involved in virulence|uniref:AAA family ATPase n=1 Tax=Malaciobacter marinus TaxID=505249 RepID=UPI0009A8827E|nr:AAA family ATPase [Malaciobacter marinus]SKB26542.1 Predicted ATP-binding protein involved in virulence [Malaciobacter marinus]